MLSYLFTYLIYGNIIGGTSTMATSAGDSASKLSAGNLFSVNGLVAVVTGGGTGERLDTYSEPIII